MRPWCGMWLNKLVLGFLMGVLALAGTPVVFAQGPSDPVIVTTLPVNRSYACPSDVPTWMPFHWQPPCTTPDPFGGTGKCFYSGWWSPDTIVPPEAFQWNIPQWILYMGAFRLPDPAPQGFVPEGLVYEFQGDSMRGTLMVCNAARDYCMDEVTIPFPVASTDINALPVATRYAPWANRPSTGQGLQIDPELIIPPNISTVVGHIYATNFSKTTAFVARTDTGQQVVLEYSLWDVQKYKGQPQRVMPYSVWPMQPGLAFSSLTYHGITFPMSTSIPLSRVFGAEKVGDAVIVHIFSIR
jgi:hypothetical protein